jgi:hypothetical protein
MEAAIGAAVGAAMGAVGDAGGSAGQPLLIGCRCIKRALRREKE